MWTDFLIVRKYILNESLAVGSQAFIFTINKTGLSLFVRSGKEFAAFIITVGVALKVYGLKFENLACLVKVVIQSSLHVIGFCSSLVVTKCIATFR